MRGRPTRLSGAALAALLAALLAAACGSSSSPPVTSTGSAPAPAGAPAPSGPGHGRPAVTLGTKNFTEELILGQLYAQALRAKGYTVNLRSNIGASEVVARELAAARIDGYPEYTGTILSVLAHDSRRPASAAQAYARASSYERSQSAQLLAMAPAEDKDVLVAKPDWAARHGIASLGDLARLGGSLTIAGPPEFRTRFDGLVGLAREYAVNPRFMAVKIGAQYATLAQGRAQVVAVFTTDGELSQGGYTLLGDPRNIFGFQNVAFVVRSEVARREGPAFAQTINAVSAKLSTQALRVMNAAVDLDQQTPAAVAHQFLAANELL